jgi:hypothetical protein
MVHCQCGAPADVPGASADFVAVVADHVVVGRAGAGGAERVDADRAHLGDPPVCRRAQNSRESYISASGPFVATSQWGFAQERHPAQKVGSVSV